MNQQQRAVVQQALGVVRELMNDEQTYEAIERAEKTITALRQLLEQPAVQGDSCGHESCDCRSYCKKQQPAPVQEPVAWPLATEEEKEGGWTLSYKFLESLSDRIAGHPAMETIEDVLLMAGSATPPAQPAPHPAEIEIMLDMMECHEAAQPAPVQEPVATLEDLEQEIYENTRQFVSRDVMEWMLKRYYTTPPAPQPAVDLRFLKQVVAVAIAGLYEHYKDDVLRVFTLDELQAVVDLSDALRPQQVEDIYKRAWEMLTTPPAAQPAPVQEPSLLATLKAVQGTLIAANEQGQIADTIWFSAHETLFDFIDAEIDKAEQATPPAQPAAPLDDAETREYAHDLLADPAQESGFFDGVKYAEQKHGITAAPQPAIKHLPADDTEGGAA